MKSSETAWHVTFGKKDKFMFLVEPLMVSRFRLTGIVEPSAVLVTSDFNENELVYFSHQIIAFAGKYVIRRSVTSDFSRRSKMGAKKENLAIGGSSGGGGLQ